MASIARGSLDGEGAEVVGRPIVDEEVILRTRDREFYVHQLQGWTMAAIGRKYGVTRQLVSFRLRHVMPEDEKERIRRKSSVPSVA